MSVPNLPLLSPSITLATSPLQLAHLPRKTKSSLSTLPPKSTMTVAMRQCGHHTLLMSLFFAESGMAAQAASASGVNQIPIDPPPLSEPMIPFPQTTFTLETPMPTFEVIPLQEARVKTATGTRGQFLQQYADYIQQLPEGQAGTLQVTEDEKGSTVRRRLTVAANALEKKLTIKRMGDEIYFWVETSQDEKPRRRGRRRSAPA